MRTLPEEQQITNFVYIIYGSSLKADVVGKEGRKGKGYTNYAHTAPSLPLGWRNEEVMTFSSVAVGETLP